MPVNNFSPVNDGIQIRNLLLENKTVKSRARPLQLRRPLFRNIPPYDTRICFNALETSSEQVSEIDGQSNIPSHLTLTERGKKIETSSSGDREILLLKHKTRTSYIYR